MEFKRQKFRGKEILGLFLRALAGASFSIGLYYVFWLAIRPLYYRNIAMTATGGEMLIVMLFFALAAVLWSLGETELAEYVKKWR